MTGEAAVPLTPTVSLTAGLRYQRDRQVRQGALTGSRLTLPLGYDRTFADWLPKVSLAWDISPDVRIGALVQRATNPGGVNLNTARARIETFGAERLWDIELFGRARLANGKLLLSANVFRYEMADAQRTQAVAIALPNGQVVTSPQIAAQQIRSLADVTRLVPGLITGPRRGVGQPTSISIRRCGRCHCRETSG